jgi:hypothetical protein
VEAPSYHFLNPFLNSFWLIGVAIGGSPLLSVKIVNSVVAPWSSGWNESASNGCLLNSFAVGVVPLYSNRCCILLVVNYDPCAWPKWAILRANHLSSILMGSDIVARGLARS